MENKIIYIILILSVSLFSKDITDTGKRHIFDDNINMVYQTQTLEENSIKYYIVNDYLIDDFCDDLNKLNKKCHIEKKYNDDFYMVLPKEIIYK